MGIFRLNRIQTERPWVRFVSMAILVVLFGLFSAVVVALVAVEASSQTFSPFAQTRAFEWDAEQWTREAPIAATLVLLPALMGLAIGYHTLIRGAILGFAVSLCNLLPFCMAGGSFSPSGVRGSPVLWIAFGVGALLAFYLGDLGSWLCRRRMRADVREDMIEEWLEAGDTC